MTYLLYALAGIGAAVMAVIAGVITMLAMAASWAERPENRGKGRVKDER